jgi:hypothetical protein
MYNHVVRYWVRALAICWCGILPITSARLSAQTPIPAVVPTNGIALVGEDFVFFSTAAPPAVYQWMFNGQALPGQNAPVLMLSNLTAAQSGQYSVAVSDIDNDIGTTYSAPSTLTVVTNVFRHLNTGRLLQSGLQVGVPIVLRCNGRESSVSFSMSYDTNHYSNPVFLPANTNATVTVVTQPGVIGVAETLPARQMFAAGVPWLGLLRFDLATSSSKYQGALQFTTNPVPIAATGTNGQPLALAAAVQPEFVLVTQKPQLDYQTGLFMQRMLVSNPGSMVMTNINLFALNLGADSSGHAITLYNATGKLTSAPLGDPVITWSDDCCGYWLDDSDCGFYYYLDCGAYGYGIEDITGVTNISLPYGQIASIPPGQTVAYVCEFYVADHNTLPSPRYSILSGTPILRAPAVTAAVLAVSHYSYDSVNQQSILQFPTRLGRQYFIQYADSLAGLKTNALTALPAIIGTGSDVQWVDNGPPKTISRPGAGTRFYRIREQ